MLSLDFSFTSFLSLSSRTQFNSRYKRICGDNGPWPNFRKTLRNTDRTCHFCEIASNWQMCSKYQGNYYFSNSLIYQTATVKKQRCLTLNFSTEFPAFPFLSYSFFFPNDQIDYFGADGVRESEECVHVLSIVMPFEVTTQFYTIQFESLTKAFIDDPFIIMPHISCTSPWPIEIIDTSIELVRIP